MVYMNYLQGLWKLAKRIIPILENEKIGQDTMELNMISGIN